MAAASPLRLHVVSLPHAQVIKAQSWCAYTQKTRRFCDMMSSLGHAVYLYAGEACEAACAEAVPCITRDEQRAHFGDGVVFDSAHPGWVAFAIRAIRAIRDRSRPGDYLCLIGGVAQQPIAAALPHLVAVEYGVGYGGVFAPFRVFESTAWMHAVLGAQAVHAGGSAHDADGRFYDAVIPNSYALEEFPAGDGRGGYLLYMARLTARKGIQVAIETAARTGMRFVVAGAGDYELPAGVEYAGRVGPDKRARLLGGAAALLSPTLYVEPFGGVAIEAMLCGTPVLATPWGAYTETVEPGVSGWQCASLAEFAWAARHASTLDRAAIRNRALSLYSTDVVRHQYDAYFAHLETLKGAGWYEAGEREPGGFDEPSRHEVRDRSEAQRHGRTAPRPGDGAHGFRLARGASR